MNEGLRLRVLLALTNASGFLSGQELASQCDVSRTAIWKHIKALREKGYQIESVPNKGYRLVSSDIGFNPEELSDLVSGPIGACIKHLPTVASTNRLAKEGARQGDAHGTVYIADIQTGGRGRRGRIWESPLGGLWISIVMRPDILPNYLPLVTMLAAVALCRAVRDVTGLTATIKWPNDVMVNGKKVAGILTEMVAEQEVVDFCVVGIGLNANFGIEHLPDNLLYSATTLLQEAKEPVNRQKILLLLCENMSSLLTHVTTKGWSGMLAEWRKLNSTLGEKVTVYPAGNAEPYQGVAYDIDDLGALLVRFGDGTLRRVLAGDVSVRRTMEE